MKTQLQSQKQSESDRRRAEDRRYQRAIEGWLAGRIHARAIAWRAEIAAPQPAK